MPVISIDKPEVCFDAALSAGDLEIGWCDLLFLAGRCHSFLEAQFWPARSRGITKPEPEIVLEIKSGHPNQRNDNKTHTHIDIYIYVYSVVVLKPSGVVVRPLGR